MHERKIYNRIIPSFSKGTHIAVYETENGQNNSQKFMKGLPAQFKYRNNGSLDVSSNPSAEKFSWDISILRFLDGNRHVVCEKT